MKNKFTDSECAVAKTHELPKELEEDNPRLLPSYTTDIEATPPVPISDHENRSQPPFTFPVQIPSIPPVSDRAFEFYNNNVKVLIHECWEIENETRSQSSCELWFKQRQLRLTASNFGSIIKRKKAYHL